MSVNKELELLAEVATVGRIDAVPMILDVVCRATGMGYAAVARVTKERWIAASVLDKIKFNLPVGGELKVDTTICDEIHDTGEMVVIDNVATDPRYCDHHTPRMYGLQSYISVPIFWRNGEFFGTLCAIDPHPASVKRPEIVDMFVLFAQLIGVQLDSQERAAATEAALLSSQQAADLREQFIAILGHDLRNPLTSIMLGARLLRERSPQEMQNTVQRIEKSAERISGLVDDLVDFSRARLGGGFVLNKSADDQLQKQLENVVAELQVSWPDRHIDTLIDLRAPVLCDGPRIAQLLSNLLSNALTHGARNGEVSLLVSGDEQHFELRVRNQGVPIAPDIQRRLFQPFVRGGDRSDDRSNKGSFGLGLGLYIVDEIARAHGGRMQVDSHISHTTFSFRIDFHAPEAV